MSIRVLGCSGAIAAGCHTTSFLLDRSILIDAGTGVTQLTLEEMSQIDHILLTHSHLDHVLSLGLLADSVMRSRRARQAPPVQVHALPETLQALHQHIFNDVLWPDFTRLPSPSTPVLRMHPVTVGQTLNLAGRQIEVLSARHTVPAVGFAVMSSGGAWVFTGDTGPNPALWQRLRHLKVQHLIIETAFPDEESRLAELSGHLCPNMLLEELSHLSGPVKVYITHIKPGDNELVMAQVRRLCTAHSIALLKMGEVMELDERAKPAASSLSETMPLI